MIARLFRHFETLVQPTGPVPTDTPPTGLLAYFRYFTSQMHGLIIRLFLGGFLVAILDTSIPYCIGRVTGLLGNHTPATLLADAWPQFLVMALVIFIARPSVFLLQILTINQAISPGMANLIRWQAHFHVVRQSWSFFQHDFAGRIANRVMQSGPSVREAIVMGADAAWYIVVYGATASLLLVSIDLRLAIPIVLWFAIYALLLWAFVPRLRDRSLDVSEMRSLLTGRVVDAYTNILTVKLFARAKDEDDFVQEAVDEHTVAYRAQTRMMTAWVMALALLNAALLCAMATLSVWLWTAGRIPLAAVTTALPLAWQLTNMAGWVGRSVTAIFENIGMVQDGMRSIAVPRTMPDATDAKALAVSGGAIRFEHLGFGYGSQRGVLHGIDLAIQPGERVGLVGPSGAGKSTLVNLLLGFYRPESGRILIDGQDIAGVTQESLRGHIAMVTQDTSLLHRSIRDNIRYGRPSATQTEVEDAARRAHAHDFILQLEDWNGRRGYDAHVGERGVKLSGGQRQRIAIARVVLKNAPILVLDEATSALDSEVEAAIQEQLEDLMQGRTVIAIAHRLSTIAKMDRLILLEAGRIVEQGTHPELLARGGAYARAWSRQSGGFDVMPGLAPGIHAVP
jgi:ATP-binding cassette subfamily B multidrug efflux pump